MYRTSESSGADSSASPKLRGDYSNHNGSVSEWRVVFLAGSRAVAFCWLEAGMLPQRHQLFV